MACPNWWRGEQDLPPIYEENSCMYVFTRECLAIRRHRIGTRPIMYLLASMLPFTLLFHCHDNVMQGRMVQQTKLSHCVPQRYLMADLKSTDIDTEHDFAMAEVLAGLAAKEAQ